MSKMAVCKECRVPLISTIAFRNYEFFCLSCGKSYGFMSPDGVEPTDKINAIYEELKAKWDANVANKLIPEGCYYSCCSACKGPPRQQHMIHASEEELKAHSEALDWLERQTGVEPRGVDLV